MQPDTDTDTDDDARHTPLFVVFVALITCTVLVAAVTFALSFYGLNDFGRTGMGLPDYLSPLVPVGVDLFSLCGIAATYLLRRAEWRIRAYSWVVFLVPTGLSVAGNTAHAAHRHLDTPGIVGAAVAPVILALATHLIVVVRRHLETDTEPDTRRDTELAPDYDAYPQLTPVSGAPVSGAGAGPDADTEKDIAMGRAMRARRDGKTIAEQAEAAGVDERTVRRWFGQLQDRPPARRSARRSASARADRRTDTGMVSALTPSRQPDPDTAPTTETTS